MGLSQSNLINESNYTRSLSKCEYNLIQFFWQSYFLGLVITSLLRIFEKEH